MVHQYRNVVDEDDGMKDARGGGLSIDGIGSEGMVNSDDIETISRFDFIDWS